MLKQIILKQIYNLKRKFFARKITHKMGKCFFHDFYAIDEIDCYVRERKIRKTKKKNDKGSYYEIDLTKVEQFDAVKEKYNLDKPIHYIFTRTNFDSNTKINLEPNSRVTFTRCTFNGPIEINGENTLISFEYNKFYSYNEKNNSEVPYLKIRAGRLSILEEHFECTAFEGKILENGNFGMEIDVDELNFYAWQCFLIKKTSRITIKAREATISKLIVCPSISIDCEKLYLPEEGITANKAVINCSNHIPLNRVRATEFIYNGQVVKPDKENTSSEQGAVTAVELKAFREELVSEQEPQIEADKIPVLK